MQAQTKPRPFGGEGRSIRSSAPTAFRALLAGRAASDAIVMQDE
jgi:hypothetical protein